MEERSIPQNIDAELAVLGSLLIKHDVIFEVEQILTENDFYRETHRIVFRTIQNMAADRQPVDMITLTDWLKREDNLDKVGGIAFITSLTRVVPTAANAVYYAKIVREKAELRRLIQAATEIAGSAYDEEEDVQTIMDEAEKKIMAVAANRNNGDFENLRKTVLETIDRIEAISRNPGALTGLPSGFVDLDRATSGFQNSDMILVAARPSMGKTAFTLNIACHVAVNQRKPVAFFSLEMSKGQLVQRLFASLARVDSQKLRTGQVSPEDWPNLVAAADALSQAPLYIDDTAGISIMELRSKARRLQAEKGLSLIVIDYLQLMQGRGNRNGDNRQQEISDISRSLKALARELNVPVIALSQLSRSVESRQVKKPMLSDLRESGSLEQDADIVMFLYREDYYDKETENQNITDVIIAKHRNGPVTDIQLYFNKEITRFSNLARHE